MARSELLEGVVIRVHARHCLVDRDGKATLCHLGGRLYRALRGATRPLAVGDRVRFRLSARGQGAVEEILPRRTKLSRPGIDKGGRGGRGGRWGRAAREQVIAANVDRVIVVASLDSPPFRPGLVDRILVAGRAGGLGCVLCLNKADLVDPARIESAADPYREIGIPVVVTSTVDGRGVEGLRGVLRGHTSVLAGPSGAGKSSLLNAVQPGLRLRVGEVSCRTRRGRHTTSSVSLLPLALGGYVVDTPGVREFGLWDVSREDLESFFPEIALHTGACRFRRCSHVHEPDCAVKEAVETGRIRRSRYESYARILASLE